MSIYTSAKKCFFSALLLAGTSFAASAQSNYTFLNGKEATEVAKNHEDEISVHIKLRNNTPDTLELTWVMLQNGFTGNDWTMVALCDPYLCHNNIPTTFNPPFYANTAGDSVSEFKLLATATPNAKTSQMKIVVWESGKENQKDTLTFTIDTRALGVNSTISPRAEIANVYPNPAQKILNFDVEYLSNNQVEIYTLSGQKLISTHLSGATKSVNIESLPKGLYIAKLQDKYGNVKISKFAKQ